MYIQDNSNVKQIYRKEGGMGHTGQQLFFTATGKAWREWVGAKDLVFCSGYNAHVLFRNLEKGSLM